MSRTWRQALAHQPLLDAPSGVFIGVGACTGPPPLSNSQKPLVRRFHAPYHALDAPAPQPRCLSRLNDDKPPTQHLKRRATPLRR